MRRQPDIQIDCSEWLRKKIFFTLCEVNMPSEESRRLLKAFGVAVTEFEDLVHRHESVDKVNQAEATVRSRLEELTAWIERLRRHAAAA